MGWAVDPAVQTALGVVGNVAALCLFLSPTKTFVRIIKRRAVEAFSPVPYVVTFLNCLLWTLYGLPLVTEDSILVSTINGIGVLISACYLTIFLRFSPNHARVRVGSILLLEGLAFSCFTAVLLLAIPKGARNVVVGSVAVVITIGMYAAPLGIMGTVVRTKSVKYMPLLLSVFTFTNGVAWTCYAIYALDYFVLVPNSLGAMLGAAQLILYRVYHGGPAAVEAEVEDSKAGHVADGSGDKVNIRVEGRPKAYSRTDSSKPFLDFPSSDSLASSQPSSDLGQQTCK